jgi:aspartate/methionine/tyrosine aminotransferase
MEFARIKRLPPYVFNITAELKMAARRRGEDIIDLSMGNPDGPTPPHIVEKLAKVAASPGVGFGDYGDDHVRFALIENEARIRQAVRGIKDMLKKDGLR